MRIARRSSYLFLCALPFLDLAVVGVRAFRIPGVYQAMGGVLFAVTLIAAWIVGARVLGSGTAGERRLALAGVLLIVPWAIISLLWVGLGAPFQATGPENHMRYLVLLADAVIVASGFVALKEALNDDGERLYSTVGFAASITAGAAYFVSISLSVASSVVSVRGESTSSLDLLREFYSVLEFVACVLTYLTVAAFAASLGRAHWLGRGAARAYVTASAVCLLLLAMRGVSYPEISGNTAPWYTRPGVIVGIPAIPWIMPCLLGVAVLRRAGDARGRTEAT